MAKAFCIIFTFLTLAIFPPTSMAGEKTGDMATDQAKMPDQQLDLARKYYDLNPVWKMVSEAIRARANAPDFSQRQKFVFITAMEKLIDKKEIREKSVPVIAELFTRKELETLISFYSNPHIKSALAKEETLSRKMAPVVTKMMDEAFLEFKTRRQDSDISPR